MRDWESAGELEMAGYVSLFSFTRTLWIWRNLSPWLASHFRSIIFSVSPFFCFSFALLSVVLLLCSSPRHLLCLYHASFSFFCSSSTVCCSSYSPSPSLPSPLASAASLCLYSLHLAFAGGAGGGGGGGGRRPGCLVSHFRCIRPPCVLKFFF